jgi:hypothetical protein
MEDETLKAIDITIPADIPIHSEGVAYYRITPEMRDFIQLCKDKHGVLGFEYTFGELNFGVILKEPRKE